MDVQQLNAAEASICKAVFVRRLKTGMDQMWLQGLSSWPGQLFCLATVLSRPLSLASRVWGGEARWVPLLQLG